MSVIFASGIMPTSVSIRLVISMSRFSVTAKYLRHQMAIFQPCHTNSTSHSSQSTALAPLLVTATVKIVPRRIMSAGLMMDTGCIRTAVTTRSVGMRYSLTTLEGSSGT
jgi:hypothetical protein